MATSIIQSLLVAWRSMQPKNDYSDENSWQLSMYMSNELNSHYYLQIDGKEIKITKIIIIL